MAYIQLRTSSLSWIFYSPWTSVFSEDTRGEGMAAKILLLTEDSRNMAKLEMALSQHGHIVLPAEKMAQALDMIDADKTVDMIVADLKLSWHDSFELLKRVRADHLLSDIPYVFLYSSGFEFTEPLRKAAAIYGCDKALNMDEFEPHRFRYELEALLPEQIASPNPPQLGEIGSAEHMEGH